MRKRNNNFYFCRIHEGDGVGLAEVILDAANINAYHYGREILYTSYASYIVPKGSPLVVGNLHRCFLETLSSFLSFPANPLAQQVLGRLAGPGMQSQESRSRQKYEAVSSV